MHTKVKRGLKGKIIRIMLIFSIIQTLAAIFVSVRVFSKISVQQNEKLAGDIASTTLSMISKDDLIALRNSVVEKFLELYRDNKVPADNKDSVRMNQFFQYFNSETQSENYKMIRNTLIQIRESNNLNDLYIFYVDPDTKNLIHIAGGIEDESLTVRPGNYDRINDRNLKKYIQNNYQNDTYFFYESGVGWASTSGRTLLDDQGKPICTIAIDVPVNKVVQECAFFALKIFLIMLVLQIPITLFMIRHINKIAVNPINQLNEAVSSLVEDKHDNIGPSKISQLSLHSGDEIEELSSSMKKMERDINGYENEIMTITTEKEHLRAELDIAAKIQSDSLPHRFPPFPEKKEIDIFASMDPAKEVGGDFYDFFLIDEDHLALVIGDVSGKGIPGALFMMASKTAIRNDSETCISPKIILERVNRQLCENNDTHMFVTVWLGILTLSDGELVYVNAGHEYPAYRPVNGKYELIKEEHDFVLGGRKKMKYTEFRRKMTPGDALFVYTDGVPEATDLDEKMYGTDRMLQALNQKTFPDMRSTLAGVSQDVAAFTAGAVQFDDLTMMGILYRGNSAAKDEMQQCS